ncbi:MAG: hypothetical protein NT062_18870 [Proteobacteria bacterium]|nr:hypothetical protein [Pseudomonadota bacterium]
MYASVACSPLASARATASGGAASRTSGTGTGSVSGGCPTRAATLLTSSDSEP